MFDFDDLDNAFNLLEYFDLYGAAQMLTGCGAGHHFIVDASSPLPWPWCSRVLDQYGIAHSGRPLADGSCLFTVDEADGERAEELLTRYGADVSRPILDDLRGLFT